MRALACGLIGGGWFWALRAIQTGEFGLAIISSLAIGVAVAIFTEWPEETR